MVREILKLYLDLHEDTVPEMTEHLKTTWETIIKDNNHHIIEAMFKAFAKALDEAVSIDPRITDVLSTKGAL